MKMIQKPELDYFLERPLIASDSIEIDMLHTCIHDDNEGEMDQCLKITLRKDASGNEFFQIHSPTSPGLRFRNYSGGGSSLEVHNALKVLIYSSVKSLHLPGLVRKKINKKSALRNINDILGGVVVLPEEVYSNKAGDPHYYFEIIPHFNVAISVDGDTHILIDPDIEHEHWVRGPSTYWNAEPFTFCLQSNCSREVYNSLILLAVAVRKCGQTT